MHVSNGVTTPGKDRRIPGEPGLWIIIFGDLAIFSLFFVYYLIYYRENPAAFALDQDNLNRTIGLVNTILLLVSSFFVAVSSRLIEKQSPKAIYGLLATIACGLGFAVLKGYEWSEKFAAGASITSSEFHMFYFMLSGVHLAHLLIGVLMLVMLVRALYRKRKVNDPFAEGVAMFWHLVDLLWVMLFPLLYLVRL